MNEGEETDYCFHLKRPEAPDINRSPESVETGVERKAQSSVSVNGGEEKEDLGIETPTPQVP